MTMLEWILLLCAAAGGTVLSALFSGMETGLYTINRVRLELRAGSGELSARILAGILRRPEHMLAVILIGTNAASQLSAWGISSILHGAGFGPIASIVIDTAILVPVLLIFAEVLPKDLFRAHGDRWCYTLARPLRCIDVLLTYSGVAPLIKWVGRLFASVMGDSHANKVNARQRMSDLLREGVDAGVLTEGQTDLLERSLQLRDKQVENVMVPWPKAQSLPATARSNDRKVAVDSRWSRLPVVSSDGHPIGIVSIMDLYTRPGDSIESLMSPPMWLPPSMPVGTALKRLRHHASAIAIVGEPGHPPAGIITIKDLVRPLLTAES